MEFKEITSNEVQTEKDVLVASCGINEEHPEEPKAQILVETKKLDLSSGEEEVIERIDLYGPIVNCFRNLQHMMLDIQFDSASDPDFIQVVRVLKEFCVPENSLDEESDKLPIVVVTIMPVSLEGEYFAAGVNGSWVVMPSQANRLPDTIRFIFNNIDFHTYRMNESELELPDETEE
ncbi:MAG: hypothetical protein IJ274_06495 [Lachnospiraceae bacterium]|nr:hypothetical protein [Lachnospiraceae bacterium]